MNHQNFNTLGFQMLKKLFQCHRGVLEGEKYDVGFYLRRIQLGSLEGQEALSKFFGAGVVFT